MSPKEKAIELYSIYYNRIEHTLSEEYSPHEKSIVKECVLIAINEILDEFMFDDSEYANRRFTYWKEVKQEIDKL